MKDSKYPIRIFATAGLAMRLFYVLVNLLCHLFPQPLFALFASGMTFENINLMKTDALPLLLLLVNTVLYVMLYLGLDRSLRTGSGKDGKVLLILTVLYLVGMPLLSTVFSLVNTAFRARLNGVEAVAALGIVNAALNWLSVLTGLSTPALAAAVAMNWYRGKYLPQEKA